MSDTFEYKPPKQGAFNEDCLTVDRVDNVDWRGNPIEPPLIRIDCDQGIEAQGSIALPFADARRLAEWILEHTK